MTQFQPSPTSQMIVVSTPVPNAISQFQNVAEAGLQVNAAVSLTTSDLKNVAVAAAERSIRSKLAELRQNHSDLQKRVTETKKISDGILENWTRERFSSVAPSFHDAMATCIGEVTIEFNAGIFNEKAGKISGTITMKASTSENSANASFTIRDNAPAIFLDALKTAKDLSEKINDLEKEIMGVRAALTNIDSLDRHAAAQIAKSVAERSAEGTDMIKKIEAIVDPDAIINLLRS